MQKLPVLTTTFILIHFTSSVVNSDVDLLYKDDGDSYIEKDNTTDSFIAAISNGDNDRKCNESEMCKLIKIQSTAIKNLEQRLLSLEQPCKLSLHISIRIELKRN